MSDIETLKVEILDLEAERQEPAVDVTAVDVTAVEVPMVEVAMTEVDADTDMAQATQAELLAQNQELLGWISELEHSLSDCQADFQAHLQQFRQQEILLERRTQELTAAQERVTVLTRDLETCRKTAQRQTILVETMTAQLETGQERIAQMERECTLVQRRSTEQAQQLLQAEQLCRDLKSRLHRQQRHTLQFKAALEKSLEVSVTPANFELPELDVEPIDFPGEFFPRSQPVKPWSQQVDEAAFNQIHEHLTPMGGVEAEDWGIRPAAEGSNEDNEMILEKTESRFEPLEKPSPSESTEALSVETGAVPGTISEVLSEALPFEGELHLGEPTNWPSPLVNPLRPTKKKLSSLAAIDLPSFPKAPV